MIPVKNEADKLDDHIGQNHFHQLKSLLQQDHCCRDLERPEEYRQSVQQVESACRPEGPRSDTDDHGHEKADGADPEHSDGRLPSIGRDMEQAIDQDFGGGENQQHAQDPHE